MCEAGSESISRAKERATRPGRGSHMAVAQSVGSGHTFTLGRGRGAKAKHKRPVEWFISKGTCVHAKFTSFLISLLLSIYKHSFFPTYHL